MKVEIGPGPEDYRNDWVRVDSVLRKNVHHKSTWGRDKLPFSPNSVSYIRANAVLEHVPWWQTEHALNEAHRVLIPTGKLEVWVPNIRVLMQRYLDGNLLEVEPRYTDARDALCHHLFWGKRMGEEGQLPHFHKAAFDFDSLRRFMLRAGFSKVQELSSKFPRERIQWLMMGIVATK